MSRRKNEEQDEEWDYPSEKIQYQLSHLSCESLEFERGSPSEYRARAHIAAERIIDEYGIEDYGRRSDIRNLIEDEMDNCIRSPWSGFDTERVGREVYAVIQSPEREDEYNPSQRKRPSRRGRRRNPRENHSGLGAFAGSVVGGIPGHIVRWAGAKNFGGLLVYMGWVAGGGIGAYYGAKDDRKRRAAIGGSIGGLFTPLGAAFGGYVAGLEPDSPRRNPAAWVIPAVAVGVLGAAGVAATLYIRHRKQAALQPADDTPPSQPDDEAWLDRVDIEKAMPRKTDFPMGWKIDNRGFQGGRDYSNQTQDWQLGWRVLELNSPSNKCSPVPCRWVTVVSGASEYGNFVSGWNPALTRDEAYKQLDQEIQDFERNL